MQFNGPTFVLPPTVPEMRYPAFVVIERLLRLWLFSRWRSARELAGSFLRAGFSHLPESLPRMFRLEEHRPNSQAPAIGLVAHFTNMFDAYYLLSKVFWCGCELIAFTTYNIFTNFESIFPAPNRMHSLPYYLDENGREEEE
ncbi:Auxin-induced protein 5NG4 [Hordeum vulgare]|nr:Auxin-induced protein 5NG4 [Hordeum vulgare]